MSVGGGTIVVAPDLDGFARLLGRYLAFVLPIGALAVFAAWLIGRAITRRAIAPLEDVASALRRIAGGDFAPEPLHVDDSQPARAHRSLQRRRASLDDSHGGARAQRVADASVHRRCRSRAADAAHDRHGLSRDSCSRAWSATPPASRHVYETMLAESRRMRAAIDNSFCSHGSSDPAAPHRARRRGRSRQACRRRARTARRSMQRIVVTAPPSPCIVEADEGELYEAIKNVVENAVRYAPHSPITVDVSNRRRRA